MFENNEPQFRSHFSITATSWFPYSGHFIRIWLYMCIWPDISLYNIHFQHRKQTKADKYASNKKFIGG